MTSGPTPDLALIALLNVFALDDDDAVRHRVIDTAAESFQAEVVGIICGQSIVRATGLGSSVAMKDALLEAAYSDRQRGSFCELGELHIISLPIGSDETTRFVMARAGQPFDYNELRMCRAMIRVMRLAVRTIWAFDEEREISHRLELEVARNRELADELHQRHSNLMARMLDL